jgi:tetratricopeptide (TPR) repeat protein
MAKAVKIFVSATSSDLRTLRNQVKMWLLDMGWLPVVQDHFPPDDKSVMDMLRKRIQECDAVIHIVGNCYGAEPQTAPKGQPRSSFTQLEAVIARQLRKRLFLVLLDESFPYDPHEPEAADRAVLQQAYRLQVATGKQIYIVGKSPEQLEPEIRKLRVEVDKLNKSRRYLTALTALPLLILLPTTVYFYHRQQTAQAQMDKAVARLNQIEQKLDAAPDDDAVSQAKAEAGSLLGNPDIDKISGSKLAASVQGVVDALRKPVVDPADFSGPVRQALIDARAKIADLKLADAAVILDTGLTRTPAAEPGRDKGRAALLAERGRVARLQLRYADAVGFYRKAAAMMSADAKSSRTYLLEAAGALYAQGYEFGDNAALKDAIAAYQAALANSPRDLEPAQWATIQDGLGLAQQRLGERESDTGHLEDSLSAYSQALEVRTRDSAPSEWATTENHLGNALLRLGERDGDTTRLEGAVEAYDQALQVRTRTAAPLDWAASQNNLGYAQRLLGERETGTERLKASVGAFNQALTVWTKDRVPLKWAMTQNNLGLSLESLGEREAGPERLEAAVAAFNAALEEDTRERVPLEWADAQNNLGLALQALGERETGTERLDQAVAAFTEALKEKTRDRVPLEWAEVQNNLGNALKTLGERKGDASRLEAAVAAYNEALKEYTEDGTPPDWAMTQDDLGNALRALAEREDGTARLDAAIAAYNEALKVRTHERMPLEWAQTIGDRGIAMMQLAKRKGDADTAREAVKQIEIAYTAVQGGGAAPDAAAYKARLSEARALLDELKKKP